jgi:hypothetical protein
MEGITKNACFVVSKSYWYVLSLFPTLPPSFPSSVRSFDEC